MIKQKQKQKQKQFIPVNFLGGDVLNNALELNKDLHPLLKQLNLKEFDVDSLSGFFSLRALVFSIVDTNHTEILSFEELKTFLNRVLKVFYSFNKRGYINQVYMESNQFFNIFRSFYPQYKTVFRNNEKMFGSVSYELEHFHNLIILVLLFEIELYQNYFSSVLKNVDFNSRDGIKEFIC